MSIDLKDEDSSAGAVLGLNFVGARQIATFEQDLEIGNINVSSDRDFDYVSASASIVADQVPVPSQDLLITNVSVTNINNLTWDSVNRELEAIDQGYYVIFANAKADFINSRLCEESFRTVVRSINFLLTTSLRTRFSSTKTWCSEADFPPQESTIVAGSIIGAGQVGTGAVILSLPAQETSSPPANRFLAGDSFVTINVFRLREFYY
jgi:hypothetical protein